MHYTVLVIGDNPEKLLAPYDENIQTAPYIETPYEELAQDFAGRKRKPIPVLLRHSEEARIAKLGTITQEKVDALFDDEEGYSYVVKYDCVRGGIRVDKYKESDKIYTVDNPQTLRKELLEDKMFEDSQLSEKCDYLSTYNPKSKWDWYSFGGRWGDNDFGPTLKDSKFLRDAEELEEDEQFWNDWVLQKNPEKCEKAVLMYKPQYYLDKYKDLETYMKAKKYNMPYAILTPDGVWHEPGKMGWFDSLGTSQEELDFEINAYERYVKPLDQNLPCVLVDCHI